MYGRGGYKCMFYVLMIPISQKAPAHGLYVILDLGNGEFEPVYATQGGPYPQQPVYYGATNA